MDSSLLVMVVVTLLLLVMLAAVSKLHKPRLNKHHFEKQWRAISEERNLSIAVIRADSLLDEAMRQANIKGTTMGERLNNSVGLLRDINGVWSAHKLRNRLAHETNSTPSEAECQRALRQFKKALKDMGAVS